MQALLDTLIALDRPFRAEAVRSALGLELVPTVRSTPYFTVFESSTPAGALGHVEVREPTSRASPDRQGMVLVTLRAVEVAPTDVIHITGPSDGVLHVPSPTAPPDSPRYTEHSRPWGVLRLGVDAADVIVRSIILDAT